MNAIFRNTPVTRQDMNLGQPKKQWLDYLAHWTIALVLSVFVGVGTVVHAQELEFNADDPASNPALDQVDEDGVEGMTTSPDELDEILARSGTVQILAWVPYTDKSREYPNTLKAISRFFTDYKVTESMATTASKLASELVGKQVFLVPEMEKGADFKKLGAAFSPALKKFVSEGGTVIVACDYRGFLTATGLMALTKTAGVSGTLTVKLSSHTLTKGLGKTVKAQNATIGATIGNKDAELQIVSSTYAAVASRNVGKGHVVLLGYDYYAYDDAAARIIANAVQWVKAPTPPGGDGCHALYSAKDRKLTIPLLDLPLLDPVTGKPTGDTAVFKGEMGLISGVDDFKVVPDSMVFIEMLKGDSKCHAKYSYADRVIKIPFADVPSVMVLPPSVVVPGPTQVFEVTMQQLPMSEDVFHMTEYKYLYTIKK